MNIKHSNADTSILLFNFLTQLNSLDSIRAIFGNDLDLCLCVWMFIQSALAMLWGQARDAIILNRKLTKTMISKGRRKKNAVTLPAPAKKNKSETALCNLLMLATDA